MVQAFGTNGFKRLDQPGERHLVVVGVPDTLAERADTGRVIVAPGAYPAGKHIGCWRRDGGREAELVAVGEDRWRAQDSFHEVANKALGELDDGAGEMHPIAHPGRGAHGGFGPGNGELVCRLHGLHIGFPHSLRRFAADGVLTIR